MSVTCHVDRFLNLKYMLLGGLLTAPLILATPGQAEPTGTAVATLPAAVSGGETVDELRARASTIADILEAASRRVEHLAAEGDGDPVLLDAIRQELSLSRSWNRHLGTILLDVAEARRALGEREREAAREIVRLTAAVEEASLELIALRRVLKGGLAEAGERRESWPESGLHRDAGDDRVASSLPLGGMTLGAGDADERRTLQDVRATLHVMEESQKSAVRDVDAVRAKIIEALETLAEARGGLPARQPDGAGALSSVDITAWAASMATRLGKRPQPAE